MRDTATRAAQGKARAQHAGVAHARHDSERVIDGISVTAAGNLQTDLGHGLIEELAVLAPLDGGKVAPDHLDAICIERAVLGQLHSGIEARLPTECGKQGVGTLSGDHLLDELWGHGLNIGAVRKPRVRHDRSRIRVQQNNFDSFFFQRTARLGSCIVKLRCLPDDDRTRTNH